MLSKFKQWLFPSPEELELRKQELQRRIAERKSKSQPEAVTRVSVPSKRPAPLPPITLSSPACPYCGVIQEPPPMRRRKCWDCGQIIHVRTEREERKKYLVTAEEAERRAAKDTRLARERRNEEWKQLSEQVRLAMQAVIGSPSKELISNRPVSFSLKAVLIVMSRRKLRALN